MSLVIAAGLEVVLHWLHEHHPRFHDLDDRALDWTVGVSRGSLPSRPAPVGYTFLDIDERTYREWQEPSEVPRDELARLIERTLAACPRLLIVDVDLTQPSRQGDAELLRVLRTQATAPLPPGCSRRSPILFPIALRGPGVRARGQDGDHVRWERRTPFLEPALAGIPNIAWASPLFERASDWQIRRWRLWERVCPAAEGRPEIIPSVQLLAAEALESPLPRALEKIRAGAGPALESCSEEPAGEGRGSHGADVRQRIIYRYPAPDELRRGESYPRDPQTGRQLLSVVPAAPLVRNHGPFDRSVFADRVVVIGGSFEEGRDVYRTPLGPMPGALILINAMDSLLEYGELELPGWPVRWGVLLLSVLGMSIIFARFPPLISVLISFALIVLLLLPASLFLFRAGSWLSFVVPVVAVFLHKLAADVEGLFHAKHQEQGR